MRTPPAGRVILLNGASSAGRSTLARRLQDALDLPFLLLSGDLLIEARSLPGRRDTEGPPSWVGQMRPRFFDGFHRCIPAMAAAGNDLIVEHVVESAGWRARLDELLSGFDVFWVAVHCDLTGIDLREAAPDHGPYDLHVDTTGGVTDDLVRTVVDSWKDAGR